MEPSCLSMHALTLALFTVLAIAWSLVPPNEGAATPQGRSSCEFPAIFNFGDSNSDTGGWSAAFGQVGPPHGETFFHAPAGRYSDGRLIIDFIAESLEVPYLNAYLDSMGSNFSHGANFATAGSTIRHQNTTWFSPFSFNVQFYQFNDFFHRSQTIRSKGGLFMDSLPKAEYFSQALYTFDMGQNDLTASYFPNMLMDQAKTSVLEILNEFKTLIKYIYSRGARYFWLHNTGPVGCLPYVLDRLTLDESQVDQSGCAIELNGLARYFNIVLKQYVGQLREDMPLAVITYVDVYSVKYDLISNANKYGFEYPLRACCGHGGKYNYDMHVGCGAKAVVNGTEVLIGESCMDPSVKISWDGAHYTEAANKWVFDRIMDGSHSDPPTSLEMACYKL